VSEWIWVSCYRIKIITVTDACAVWVNMFCWRVCSTFYDQKITKQWNKYTHTHTYSIFMASFTNIAWNYTACKQESLWSITCILDVVNNQDQQKTVENKWIVTQCHSKLNDTSLILHHVMFVHLKLLHRP